MTGPAELLRSAAERSAAPAVVGAAVQRLVEERTESLEVLADGDELSEAGRALVAVMEASNVLGRLCMTDPDAIGVLAHLARPTPWSAADADDVARSKRLAVLRIAARDLLGLDTLDDVGAELAALAARVLDASVSLAAARTSQGRGSPERALGGDLAVIGMGKLGGQELNYASDVDILFVTGDGDGTAWSRAALDIARRAFRVDVDLRPEGRAGPLSRPLESYRSYWGRWAEAWEFQALIKARPVAGDVAVGDAFAHAADEVVWGHAFSADELTELRSMKARTEALVARRGLAGRERKRGPGGIRDVEFAVQLLQLVHGRLDPAIRRRSTLVALTELAGAGYVSDDDAAVLADHYRFLRTVEHRLQLVEEEQVHAVPPPGAAHERLARVLGFVDEPRLTAAAAFDEELRRRQSEVRAIHERLFFRPLLEAFADAPRAMEPGAVERQLAAFGFADAARTRAAVRELAGGLTRTSRLMAQLLPLLLDWLSLAPDPDLGLLGLRTLVVHRHHRTLLVNSFRDSPEAARRLCLLLGSSRALGEAVTRNPELISGLDDDRALAAPGRDALVADAAQRLARAEDDDTRRAQLLRLRQDQFVRTAMRDLLGLADVSATGVALSTVAEALIESALQALAAQGPFCVVGLGRLGGGELSYGSDLDVLFVHGAGAETTGETLLHLFHGTNPASRVATIDLGLRPEGSQGRLSRDVEGYRLYFERWAQTWERQALLRARVVAGDDALGREFMAAVDDFVWGSPIGDEHVAEIRRMKARVERERIPPREDPQFHLKLGKGALADVEWTVQLLQLRTGLREASTTAALDKLQASGTVDPDDADALRASYRFCEHTRNRWHLVGALAGGASGGDSLPTQPDQLSHLARSLGTTPSALRDEYRRATRRARRVVERLFYGLE